MSLKKKRFRIRVGEITIGSSLRLFQYRGGSPGGSTYDSKGGSTGSEVMFKLQLPDGVPSDAVREIVLRQKWELDYILLEIEHARGSLPTKEFEERTSALEEMYLSLLEDDVEEDDDEDE